MPEFRTLHRHYDERRSTTCSTPEPHHIIQINLDASLR